MNIMDFNVKKLAADAGTFLSRAVQVRRGEGSPSAEEVKPRFPSFQRGTSCLVPLEREARALARPLLHARDPTPPQLARKPASLALGQQPVDQEPN